VLFSSGILAELLLAKSTKTLVEFINTTTSLSSFLLTSVKAVSPLDQSLLLPSTIRVKNNGGECYRIIIAIAIKIAKNLSNS
jgi:hypothetical protein